VEDTEGSELGDGTGGGQEKLKDMDSVSDLSVSHIPHIANSLGSLEVDHLALVSEPAIKELHHWLAKGSILLSQLSGQSHQHDKGSGALDRSGSTELLNHLDQCHAIV
jgi:hypothetical protein